ncbi:MAG: sulfite exporter TauE/SafE family protein [Vicinamibacterales bacterium]
MHQHVHTAAMAAGSHLDLVAFLMLGVLGSAAHCVGMCTPFVFMVSRRYSLPAGAHIPWVAQAWYHAGRLTTYGLLGALGGAVGSALQVAGALVGLQRAAAILAGAALIITGAASLVSLQTASGPGAWAGRLTSVLGRRMPGHPYALGVVLGLLPCGLLYSAVVAAMATGSAAVGAAGLVLFGLGTAPALVGISLADALIVRRRALLNRLAQVFVLVMGAWFVYHGVLAVPMQH